MAKNWWEESTLESAAPKNESADEWWSGAKLENAPQRTWGEAIKDTGAQLAEGVNTTLGAIPSVVAPQSKAAGFFRDNAQYWRDQQSDVLKGRIAETDKRIAEAGKDGVLSQIGTAASEYWNDPAQAARLVATNLPSMAATLGTGAAAGFAAKGVAAARGLDAANKAALAAKYGTTTAYATNAALNAGGARGEAFEDLQKSALAQGMTPEQAEQAGVSGSIMPGVVGAVTGAISGKIGLEKAILGQATTGAAMRKAAGAFGAELAGEQIEELAPKVATNYQVGRIDPGRTLTDDLGRTMVETAIGSGPGAVVAGGAAGMRTGELPPSPGAGDPTTSPGAADPNAPVPPGAAPVEAPEAPDLTTSPGAGVARDGIDFTREVDTSGLSLQDPAELERARAATVDYQPGGTTPQWDTQLGATGHRQGLDMPAPEIDTTGLGLDPIRQMVKQAADAGGALSPAALTAIDVGATPVQFVSATGRDLQARATGPGVANESNVIDVQGRVVEDRAIGTPRRLTAQESAYESGAQAFRDGAPRAEIVATQNVVARAHQLRGYDDAAQKASSVPALPAPTNLREGLERIRAQRQEAANAQAATPETAPSSAPVPAAGTGAVEAAGPVSTFPTIGANSEPTSPQAIQTSPQPAQAAAARAGQAAPVAAPNTGEAQTGIRRGSQSPTNQTPQESAKYDRWMQVIDSIEDGAVYTDPISGDTYTARVTEQGIDKRGKQRGKSVSLLDGNGVPAFDLASNGEAGKDAGYFGASIEGLNGPAWTFETKGNAERDGKAQPVGAQAAPAAGAQGAAPAESAEQRTQRVAQAGEAWTRMPAAQREALAGIAAGLNPIQRKRVPSAAWADLNRTIQSNLADAMGGREEYGGNSTGTSVDAAPAAINSEAQNTGKDAVRIGRDQTPLSEGGKPFKTRKAAGDAKKLQPMMRVVTVPGGYALAEKTPAQLAAEERASRRLRNPNTSARGEPIPAHAFIAASGGLNRVAASDMGVDGNPRIGNRTLFAGQGRGLSMDQATQMLIQDGYLSEGATINDALALIKKSLTQPQYNADGIERIAQAEADAQFEDYLAAQEEAAAEGDADPFGMANEFTAEELDEVGYTDADPALQAEVAALTAQAEAIGIDTFAILEDIARTYANATQDQYNAAARDALAQAIARGNQDGGSTAAQAAPAAEPAADQGLDPTPALELASQTPAEAAAQQEAQEQAAKAEAARQRAADQAASKTPTIDAHNATMAAVREGIATPDQFKASFEAVVSNKDAIKAELSTKTKAELLKDGGAYFRMRYANENKADVVDAVYSDMLGEYALGESVTYGMARDSYQKAVRRLVEATDADKLARYVADRKAAAEEYAAQRAAKAAALENPQTLTDYRSLIQSHINEGKTRKEAFLMLTPEQRIQYDTLEAESTKEARESRKRAAKTEVRTAGQTTGGEIIATKHTRDGYDLFVVKLADRLSADDYKTVLASAKKLGGWYSAFRGNGAIPGFQFKDKTNAEAFLALAGGDTTAAQKQVAQRRDAFEDDRSQGAAERLNEMAGKLEESADEEINRDRKANTARRARFASAALGAARAQQAMAKTMRNIAKAIEDGRAKFLDAVRTKTQVEMLTGFVRTAKNAELRAKYESYAEQEKRKGEPATAATADFAEFPAFTAFRSDLATLARQMLEVDGTKKLGQQLMKVADDVTDAYLEFAKANIIEVSAYGNSRNVLADFDNKVDAENAIRRNNLTGKAIVLPMKRGHNRVILSPSEAMNRGIWKGDGDKRITLSGDFGKELVEAIGRRGSKQNGLAVPWQFQTAYDRRKALARIGIETPSEFRSALREFVALQETAVADKVRDMELSMVGRKADGLDFFPTPAEVADQMVEAADIQPDMAVLEPSAGMGHLADRIREAGAEPDVIEISPDRRALLEEKGYTTQDVDDFLDLKPREFFTFGDTFRAPDGAEGIMRGASGNRVRLVNDAGDMVGAGYYDRAELTGVAHNGTASGYDRIIMNPPFSNRRDAEHVRHAYSLLKPGGRIVAIMGEGVFFGSDKKAQEFREWLESVGGTSEKLPDGSFLDPSLPVTTGANARMVVIDKAEGVAMFSRTGAQSANANESTSRAWYDRFVSLLPESYRNDPHRREPLPAEDWNVQRASEVRSKVEALNKQLRGADDRKGYGPVSVDGLGNLQVDARDVSAEDLTGDIMALANELGAGIAATNVRSADARALQNSGFVPESSLAAIADRLMQRPFASPTNNYAKDSAPGTVMTYKPRGFPAALFARDVVQNNATPAISRADSNARNVATQMLVDGLKAKWTRAPEIIVARNMQDPQVPQAVRDYDETLKSQGATGEARGFIYEGKVYLLSDQLKGPEQIAEVLFHEVLGHYGLRGVFGESLTPILQQIGTMRRRDVVAKAREYGLFDKDALGGMDKKTASDAQIWAAMSAKDRLSAAEEVLAEMAQTQPNIGFVQRAIAAIRNWLRANVPGFKSLRLTDADIIQAYILPARGFVTRSKETGAQSLERAMMAFSRVWHGSPHKFLLFDSSKIGTGEGAQAYGHGLYLAESKGVAGSYQESLSTDPERFLVDGKEVFRRQANGPAFDVSDPKTAAIFYAARKGDKAARKYFAEQGAWGGKAIAELNAMKGKVISRVAPGNLYQVDLPDEHIAKMLDWDKPLSEQTPEVRKLAEKFGYPLDRTGGDFQRWSSSPSGGLSINLRGPRDRSGLDKQSANMFSQAGIPGIRYLDGSSRGKGAGTSNYVIFPGMEKILTIIDVNGEPVTGAEKAKVLGEQMDLAFSRTAGDQTQTEAFKRWFAGSRVVDADGKPLVVYHGTHSSFTEFKPNDALGGGMFFSPSPEEAGAFTGATGSNIMPVYLSAQKVWPKIVRSYDEVKAIRAAKSKGYDAIRVRDDQNGVVNWVVFDPTQVKSATGNNGDFDPANPDIRRSATAQPPRTPAATIRAAITRAYGKLLGQLEAKGLVTLTQTEDEAIEAAAQARADKTGQPLAEVRASLMGSVSNSVATDTPAFKRWFSGSKVVDADGKPLVVYHGTASDIAVFDPEKTEALPGIFMTPIPYTAGAYASAKRGSANVMPLYVSLKNPVELTAAQYTKERLDAAYSGDADGIIVRNWETGAIETVIAFNPQDIKSAIGNNGNFDPNDLDIRRSANGAIQGFFDPQTGQSFLIADNLTAEAAPGVLMHEVGIHMAADGSMKALFNRAAMMLKLQKGNPFMKAVQARMDAAGETSGEEAAAYIAEAYENDSANAPASVQRWLADLLAAVKAWMFKKGIMGADRLTVADIAAVARANARSMARDGVATGGQGFGPAFSVGEDVGAKALAEFAKADELFALPKSGKDTVSGIAADIDPEITVRVTRLPGETMYTLNHPAFGVARITERSGNPYGPSLYGYNQVDGEITDQITERPGDNPEDVEPGTGDVWVDVSLLKPGQGGEKIYAIAANYAHNTGQIFIGDPAGLSKVALRRRLEQMLSSALKFGTTAHLAPHPDQVRGGDGVPPLQWVYGDHVGNVERMIAASVKALDNGFPQSKLIEYRSDGNFYNVKTGRQIPRGLLASGLGESIAKRRGVSGAEGSTAQAGWRTIARAALFRHLQSTIAAAHGGLQERGRLLAGAGANVSRLHSDGTTGPVGSDQERATRIFYSRAGVSNTGGQAATGWDTPTPTGFDDVIYKLQDKNIDLKRVVESITKATGKVSDSINAYLKEELFHKRAAKRVADFGDRELKPLMNKMRLAGLSMEDVEEYLHARHAKEANAVIAQRNPGNAGLQDGGSGMTNAAADNYFAKLDPAQRRKLEAVAKSVDAIIDGTRKLYVDYGLEDQAVVDGWANMYQHYIPLMREDKDGGMGTGQGFSVKGKETKGRTGSTRKVVDILANVAMQREKLIVRGEKNIVAQALVGLAQANPNPDFWEVRSQAPTERVFDPKTGVVVDRPDPLFKSRENVAVAKVKDANGKVTEQMVVFNEDNPRAVRMAAAMKNLDAGNLEGLLGVSAKITRYFAAINTQYNPVFGVVNLVRDVQGAMVNLGTTPLAGQQGKIAKDTLSALRGIYGDIRKTRKGGQATSQWSQLWEQMQDDGGTTGYRDLFKTSADRANDLKSILNPEGWMDSKWGKFFTADGRLKVPLSMAQKGATEIFGWLSDYNEAMENGVRLAAYKAALDKGMSREQAASLAKNLTVNFNRKGQAGMQAGAVYAFFNAAMQGTARIGQTLFDMDGGDLSTLRLSKTGKAVVYGGVMLGVMQALALSAAGFDDDDPPEFVRERSLIIPTGDKTYVSIPMPLGLHVIPGIGRHATEFALSGFDKPAKRAVSMVGMFADAFNPIGNAGLSMQTIAPTALDPLVALSENKDWTGKPIARVSSNKAMPGHTQWKDTATGFSKVVAEAINWISGGNEYVAGAFSPTPDQIDYLLAQVGGGVAREAAKVQQTISTAMSGETLPTHKIPLVGRFVGNAASQASQGSAFYANLNKLNELETEIKGLRKDGRFDEAAKLARENPQSILIAMANRAERDVQRMRREKRELIANDASREQVRAKEDQITDVMTRLNEAVERRKAQAAR